MRKTAFYQTKTFPTLFEGEIPNTRWQKRNSPSGGMLFVKFAKKMAQMANFWPPEWPIQSTPPHRRSTMPTRQSMQRPNEHNKDCRVGQLTTD